MFGLILFFILYSIFSIALGFVIFAALKLILLILKKESGHAKDIIFTPIKMAPYFLIAIFINAFICEYVREVDAPLSDYWSFPLIIPRKFLLEAIVYKVCGNIVDKLVRMLYRHTQ